MNTARKYLGIDVGGTFIKLGVVDENGTVSLRREVPIDRSGSETVMETITRGVDAFLLEHGLDALDLEGIGVSAAGCIDTAKGCVAENGGNVPGWSRTEVTGPLSERYGIDATMANDGNCVALAEAWTGAAKGLRDVICVVLGTGVGGGIISGGRLIEGARGFGGEIGHFPTHAEKRPAFRGDLSSDYEKHAATSALVGSAAAAGCPWNNGRDKALPQVGDAVIGRGDDGQQTHGGSSFPGRRLLEFLISFPLVELVQNGGGEPEADELCGQPNHTQPPPAGVLQIGRAS